ncbi:MAG: helix-turn-helix transcriptional regulator [Rhodobacteraceae bacterium]|nr:helix-turn-helix transcriptional regulator [Paracoccaceae bacterium]
MKRHSKGTLVLLVCALVVQFMGAGFFIAKILSDVFLFRIPFIPWEMVEVLELMASVGLLFGVASSVTLILMSVRRIDRLSDQITALGGQFQEYIDRQFLEWNLTPTERNVALLAIKGFSNAEIARLRGTTESTVKSQLTSIFRKTGLSSRQQLTTYFIEDLVSTLDQGPQ